MSVTIQSIADACGLSITSVSLVLNEKPNRISEEKRKLILDTAKRLHYRPNVNAVGLAGGRTGMAGFIVSDIGNIYLSEIAGVIEAELHARGYSLLLGNCNDECGREYTYLNEFINRNVEGIILLHSSEEEGKYRKKITKLIENSPVPIVMLENDLKEITVSRCIIDNENGGYLATKHLIDYGHRRIGCVLGPIGQYSVKARLAGYKKALKEAGIPFDKKLLFSGDFTLQSGRDALHDLMQKDVTGVFCHNDMMAYGILAEAKENRIRIGKDIAIVGYDDIFTNELLDVTLTSVRQPRTVIAKTATELLYEEVTGERKEKKTVVYQPELVIRNSSSAKHCNRNGERKWRKK